MKVYVGRGKSLISGYGGGFEETVGAMWRGVSALREKTWVNGKKLWVQSIDGEINGDGNLSRLEKMGVKVMRECIEDNGWKKEVGRRVGVVLSTTKGNIREAGESAPEKGNRVMIYEMARRIVGAVGLDVEPVVVCNACISGVAAVIVGSRMIRRGVYDEVFVVGMDESSQFVTSGFMGFRSVSERKCVPYDSRRDGLSLGEAAGCLMLSNQAIEGAEMTIEGGALNNDANHISGPSRTGEPLGMSIEKALGESKRTVNSVAFVNAHGTGTVYNDEMEAKAICLARLDSVRVNSLKPYLGHTLGASGLIELMVCGEELKRGEVLGTLGFKELGVSMPLKVSGKRELVESECCVKTASGFGGCNAAVVMSKVSNAREIVENYDWDFKMVRSVDIKDGKILVDGVDIVDDGRERVFADLVREGYHRLGDVNMKFFKMDDLCKMGYIGAEYLLKGLDINEGDRRSMAILMANRSGSLDTDIEYIKQMRENRTSPGTFVYTLPNIVIGEICIRHGIRGESLFIIEPERDDKKIREQAKQMLNLDESGRLICGWCEKLCGEYELHLELLDIKRP